MDDKKKIVGGEIAAQSPALRWLDNFWYHYKWPVIGIAVAVVIVLVCVLQTCTTKKADNRVIYAGPTFLQAEEREQISQVLSALSPEAGEKEVWVQFSANEIYSEEQIREFEENSKTQTIDRVRNRSEYEDYRSYMQTGQSSVYFLDPWLYESLSKDYLCPLATSVGSLPEGALADGYGVRLGDTALYRDYGVLRYLPEDTVVCLMNPLFMTKSWQKEAYQRETDLFAAIVTYEGDGARESGT